MNALNKALLALCITLRYSTVRKQFPNITNEYPIIEYQLQQHRLIPNFSRFELFFMI
jgi:alkylation response protein AidB-like acyl-CoA dehydrogenase